MLDIRFKIIKFMSVKDNLKYFKIEKEIETI
jgi:hypothetical protein